jgi:hypothetical protein
MTRCTVIMVSSVFLVLLAASSIHGQEAEHAGKRAQASRWFVVRLSDQDVLLPVSSIEWGTPDRWSLTARYIHMFVKDRADRTVLNNLVIALSPGTAGGRLAIGHQSIVSPRSMPDVHILSEARLVILRTWGNPLSTVADRTFVGGEIRGSPGSVINIGIGYFTQLHNSNGRRDHVLGFHIGVGM